MLEVKPFSERDGRYRELLNRGDVLDTATLAEAAGVMALVREGGDGLLRAVREHDSPAVTMETLRVGEAEIASARGAVSERFLTSLSLARVNIRKFHEYQRRRGYMHDDNDGVRLSRQVRALGRVGVCCGGSFVALLMHAVPAQVAGVGRIAVAAAPQADGSVDPRILAAAKVLDIDEVYRMSGSRAVAAFAYGAGPVAKADKVVGPGGASARAAKALLGGRAGAAAETGRGELLIIADGNANAKFIASDLLAQAEFEDGGGLYVLMTDDLMLAQAVRIEMARLADLLPNAETVRRNILRRGAIYVVPSLSSAVTAANALAPARVCLLTGDNGEHLADIQSAGSVFIGPWSAGAAGGVFAGANPYLPLGGASAHATGLGVDDFVRETTVVEYGPDRFLKTGRHLASLAEEEGLPAHAEAVRERLDLLKMTVE